MDSIINFDILKHPINWVVVLLMLTIAGVGGHLLASLVGIEPKTNNAPQAAGYTSAS